MMSSVWLERPGRWRAVGAGIILLLAALPAVPLLSRTLAGGDLASLGSGFGSALRNSIAVMILTAFAAFVVGLPAGVVIGLYEFRGRRVLLAISVLPILVPSFLWALGWSALAARLGPTATAALSGPAGCALVFFSAAFPLVLLTAFAATAGLTGSQVDAARLSGGEGVLFRYTCGYATGPALLAAGLGGVLTLSDPGPGQILGLRTVASEVLTSFAALYDFDLAGRQCSALAVLVLVAALPLGYLAAPGLAAATMGRQTRTFHRVRNARVVAVAGSAFALILLGTAAPPLVGLTLPVTDGGEAGRAWREVSRTGLNTLLYAAGSGFMAAILGILVAFFVGRSHRLRIVCLGACVTLFTLPPALGALGIISLASGAPAWTDPLLRSRATVCLALGLRFFPVAAVLGLRAWGSMSPSWAYAAAISGVPLGRYLRKVVLPVLLPSAAIAVLLVALLATADVGTVLLLHPPGQASLPLAIFTIMANAPESLVATLCLAYIGFAALPIAGWAAAERRVQ